MTAPTFDPPTAPAGTATPVTDWWLPPTIHAGDGTGSADFWGQ